MGGLLWWSSGTESTCQCMQGTQARSLVWEDSTCRGATKPMYYNYWTCTLEPASSNYWSPCSARREATALRSSHTTRRSSHHPLRLENAQPKKKKTSELKERGRKKVLRTRASALDVTWAHGCYCLKSKRRQEGKKEMVSLPWGIRLFPSCVM